MLLCCFEVIWGKFYENLLFSQKKRLSQKGEQKYSESLFFFTSLKGSNPEENLDFFKQLILIKPVKLDKYQINKNCFSPQNEPHTAKLCFPIVLNHFRGNSLNSSVKQLTLRKKLGKTWKASFSQQGRKVANKEENLV